MAKLAFKRLFWPLQPAALLRRIDQKNFNYQAMRQIIRVLSVFLSVLAISQSLGRAETIVITTPHGDVVGRGTTIDPADQAAIIDFFDFYAPGITSRFVQLGGKIAVGPIYGDQTEGLHQAGGANIIVEPGNNVATTLSIIFHELTHIALDGAPFPGDTIQGDCEHAWILLMQYNLLADLNDYTIWRNQETPNGPPFELVPCDDLREIYDLWSDALLACFQGGTSPDGSTYPGSTTGSSHYSNTTANTPIPSSNPSDDTPCANSSD